MLFERAAAKMCAATVCNTITAWRHRLATPPTYAFLMKIKLFSSLVLAGAFAAGPSFADDLAPRWTLGVSGSLTQTESARDDDPANKSGAVSLERHFSNGSAGLSLGASGGEEAIPSLLSVTDTSAFDASAWIGWALGPVDVQVGAIYGRQTLDGVARGAADRPNVVNRLPAQLRGRSLTVDGDRTTTGASITASRTFGDEVNVTPSVTISYAKTETEGQARGAQSNDPIVGLQDKQSGTTGSIGVTFGRNLGAGVTGSFSLAAVATDNAAAETLIAGRSVSGLVRRTPGEAGGDEWGEVNGALTFQLQERTALALSLSASVGRDEDDVSGGVSLSQSF
jgi:hypothetical protein